MNKITKSTPMQDEPLSLLLLGPPGGGKTTLALQFPNPWVADCDLNLAGPSRFLLARESGLEFGFDTVARGPEGEDILLADQWSRLLDLVTKAARDEWVKTIVIDSLTHINYMILTHVLTKQGVQEMTRREWIPFRQELLRLVWGLPHLCKKHCVYVCHESFERNDKGAVVKHSPAVSSKLTDHFGAYFTNVWRCTSAPGVAGHSTFSVQTGADGLNSLKNTFSLPFTVDVTNGAKALIERCLC